MKAFKNFQQANNWLLSIGKKTTRDAIPAVSQQAYKDVKEFTYWDEGTMYQSGSLHSKFAQGIVTMIAPQVRRLYYGDASAGPGNRRAISLWWEETVRRNVKEWKRIYIKIYDYYKR